MRYISTIGFFDGVHLGHRFLLEQLACVAKENKLSTKVISFQHHPRSVLSKSNSETCFLLTTFEERKALLSMFSDKVLMLNFADIHSLTARQFMHYLHQDEQVDMLMMGYDHRFGSDMPSTFEDYQHLASLEGIRLIKTDEYSADNHVSSTVIRNLLKQGNVSKANSLLGYDYTISGRVVHGRQLGRQIGFPTANVAPDPSKLIPLDGVYEVEVLVNNECRRGILNIGCNPTIDASTRTLEVHIPDYAAQLYDSCITLRLKSFIRPEIRFDSLEQLKQQIQSDINILLSTTPL